MLKKSLLLGLISSFLFALSNNENIKSIEKLDNYKIYQSKNTFYDLAFANEKDLSFIPFKLPIDDINIDIMKNSLNSILLFKNNKLFMLIKKQDPVKKNLKELSLNLLKKCGKKNIVFAKIVLLNKTKGAILDKTFKKISNFLSYYKEIANNPNTMDENNLLLSEIICQKSPNVRKIYIYRTKYRWDKEKCPKCEMMQEEYRHLIGQNDLTTIYIAPIDKNKEK